VSDFDPVTQTDRAEHPTPVNVELGFIPTNPPHLGLHEGPPRWAAHFGLQ